MTHVENETLVVRVRIPQEYMAELRVAAWLEKMTVLEVVQKAAEESVRDAVVAYLKKNNPEWFDKLFIPVEEPKNSK
jgi:uncharacterized protein YehS (DUF1456 family)